ncbi:MAG: hypothetical protein RMM31_06120, partial [Anaerolineae bacterium]|nr:hypothetical protein [Anaerolineae bacterium]
AVSAVVLRALARDPRQRWATAGEFARQLEAAARASTVRKPSPLPALGALTGLAAVVLVAGAWLSLASPPSVPQPTNTPAPSATVTLRPLPSLPAGEPLLPTEEGGVEQPTPAPQRAADLKPSVTPLPELERRTPQPMPEIPLAPATEPVQTPRPTRTPRLKINLELSGVSGQERWGMPMNPDGCNPPYNDRQPVWRYKVTLTIRHTGGTAPLTDWSVKLFNQGVPLHTCPLYGSYAPIQPGETRQVEIAAFLAADPAVQARVISNSGIWRLCFQGNRGIPC